MPSIAQKKCCETLIIMTSKNENQANKSPTSPVGYYVGSLLSKLQQS